MMLLIPSAAEKVVGTRNVTPMRPQECHIATRARVLIYGNQEQWRGIGSVVCRESPGEPGHKRCALGDLVFDLAVFSLKSRQEFQRSADIGEVTDAFHGQGRPFRIPT